MPRTGETLTPASIARSPAPALAADTATVVGLSVWIRLPDLSYETAGALGAAEPVAVATTEPAAAAIEPPPVVKVRIDSAAASPAAEANAAPEVAAIGRRSLYNQIALPAHRSVSPVALFTGMVAAAALFFLLILSGRKSPTDESTIRKVDTAAPASAPVDSTAAPGGPLLPPGQGETLKKPQGAPEQAQIKPSLHGALPPQTDLNPVCVYSIMPQQSEAHPTSYEAPPVGPTGVAVPYFPARPPGPSATPTTYPQTSTPWGPEFQAELPREYRAGRPVAEFEGTIQKPDYRAAHEQHRSRLH